MLGATARSLQLVHSFNWKFSKNVMNQILRDIRQSWRVLRKNPGFTIVALLSLSLGIGANTAIFSIFKGVVLNPYGFAEDPDRLV